MFGGYLILGRGMSGTMVGGADTLTMAQRLANDRLVQLPYPIVVVILAILAVVLLADIWAKMAAR